MDSQSIADPRNPDSTADTESEWQAEPAHAQLVGFLHQFTDRLSTAICLYDRQFRLHYGNQRFFALFGVEEDAAIDRPLQELLGAAAFAALRPELTLATESDPVRFTGELPLRNGVRYLEVQVISSVQRGVSGTLALFDDVTEQKLAQDGLSQLAAIMQSSAVAILCITLNGDIRNWNEGAESVFGYTAAEIIGQPLSKIILEGDTGGAQDVISRVAAGHSLTDVVATGRKHDGTELFVLATFSPIRTAEGSVIAISSICQDITARIQVENALLLESAALGSVANGIVITDVTGTIKWVNPAFTALTGYDREEVIGRKPGELVKSGVQDTEFYRVMWNTILSGKTWHGELINRRKDGALYSEEMLITPVRDQSGIIRHFVAIKQDVTERKALEKAQLVEQELQQSVLREKALSELKTQFVSMASHEFRNPLAAILATVDTLAIYRDRMSVEQIDRKLENIRTQISQLTEIMDDVLNLSDTQARRSDFTPTVIDLDLLFREVIESFEVQPKVTHKLIYTSERPLPPAHVDRKLMRQIIGNLISNAVKYSAPEHAIAIGLSAMDGWFEFTVRDRGIGIAKEDLSKLFNTFHRGNNVGSVPGTGLGLAIARESVDLHGGTIAVDSVVGEGTTFTVRVPVLQPAVKQD